MTKEFKAKIEHYQRTGLFPVRLCPVDFTSPIRVTMYNGVACVVVSDLNQKMIQYGFPRLGFIPNAIYTPRGSLLPIADTIALLKEKVPDLNTRCFLKCFNWSLKRGYIPQHPTTRRHTGPDESGLPVLPMGVTTA